MLLIVTARTGCVCERAQSGAGERGGCAGCVTMCSNAQGTVSISYCVPISLPLNIRSIQTNRCKNHGYNKPGTVPPEVKEEIHCAAVFIMSGISSPRNSTVYDCCTSNLEQWLRSATGPKAKVNSFVRLRDHKSQSRRQSLSHRPGVPALPGIWK